MRPSFAPINGTIGFIPFEFGNTIFQFVDPSLSPPDDEKNDPEEEGRYHEYDQYDEEDNQEFWSAGNGSWCEYIHDEVDTYRSVRGSDVWCLLDTPFEPQSSLPNRKGRQIRLQPRRQLGLSLQSVEGNR